MKRFERKWMYERLDDRKKIRIEFVNGVEDFIEIAKQQECFRVDNVIRCPCALCENTKHFHETTVKHHLYAKGFKTNYFDWISHGEKFPGQSSQIESNTEINPYRDMVIDAMSSHFQHNMEERLLEEEPNQEMKSFFDMLNNAQKPLYEGSKVSLLQATSRLITLKCEYNLAHTCVDKMASLIDDIIPDNSVMTRSFYDTKKLLRGLELPHQKIDACPSGCMIFWKEDVLLDKCKKCGSDRYKPLKKGKTMRKNDVKRVPKKVLIYLPIAPRLQRLYATKKLAEEMRWHAINPRVSGTMSHPSDGEAWKDFDDNFPDFSSDPRNVRLGLCTDGFSPFGQFGKSYSCWPIMLTPYNLPPWLCMKRQFIFLSLIIPGPKNPKQSLDVYMQPLIEELKHLWEVGVSTYDMSIKQNFQLKAALMWTINDFPAYGMLSGWTTAGVNACPYCLNGTKSFRLTKGGKQSWFDCHRQFLPTNHPFRKDTKNFLKDKTIRTKAPPIPSGHEVWRSVQHLPTIVDSTNSELKKLKDKKAGWWKRSIFWELPYWKNLLLRHNLDVMHIEKNFFEQLIHTIMDVKKKTSHGPKSKEDVKEFCPDRENQEKFILNKQKKKVLCEWFSKLKFPDRYASDLSRCVDSQGLRLHGLKSHDCHVIMERLLPVALKRLLPANVWNAITEISQFFRDLCSSSIKVDDMIRLETNIPVILCKLEKIFPPSFFNSMEHLPIHLAYEAKVGGPVQYRWMYPFERFLNHLKRKVGNKARVEGSICNAYITEEIANFCSLYFEEHIDTKAKDLGVGEKLSINKDLPEMFRYDHEGTSKKGSTRFLDTKDIDCAHLYVLKNCEFLREYEKEFEKYIITRHPQEGLDDVWGKHEESFPKWLKDQVIGLNENNSLIRALAMGPSRRVTSLNRFAINGFNFHTFDYGEHKSTLNYGVCVTSDEENDYYGILREIIELSYYGSKSTYKTVLFRCDWFDNSPKGINVHDQYKLVEVNHKRKYQKYDPFVLAHQAEQVYYATYPSVTKDRDQWWAVFKTKARSRIDAPIDTSFFQEAMVSNEVILSTVDEIDDGRVGEEEEEVLEDEEDVILEDEEELEDEGSQLEGGGVDEFDINDANELEDTDVDDEEETDVDDYSDTDDTNTGDDEGDDDESDS